jgi:peptidoglycan/xylan/chitin deacetylase (PgdA/CDA1 family)
VDALERAHVPATFFEIGRLVPGHGTLLHRMLRDGDAIGNHTYTHANLGALPAARIRPELKGTSAAIHTAAGYRPCLFRPPYGAYNRSVLRIARGAGMATITWNVDPRDWSRPGTPAIVQQVLRGVRPGSIVILHDGGGPRGQTLAALPRIIKVLRKRGYRFRTVAQLLGFKPT